MGPSLRRVDLLVTDLDNTLWDWLTPWARSMEALVDGLHSASGVPREQLFKEIHAVHQRFGTVEYSVLVNELPSLGFTTGTNRAADVYDEAVHAQNSARKAQTKLYPGVRATLESIRSAGVPVVAYSEGLEFWTAWRIRTLGLNGLITRLYTLPDHDFPDGVSVQALRRLPPNQYEFGETDQRTVSRDLVKPNPQVLREIVDEYGVAVERVAYVGDSLSKDVAMAQTLGAIDVYAEYGATEEGPDSHLLMRLSHWTAEEIELSRSVRSLQVTPSYTLRKGFDELLTYFQFGEEPNEAEEAGRDRVDGRLGSDNRGSATFQ